MPLASPEVQERKVAEIASVSHQRPTVERRGAISLRGDQILGGGIQKLPSGKQFSWD